MGLPVDRGKIFVELASLLMINESWIQYTEPVVFQKILSLTILPASYFCLQYFYRFNLVEKINLFKKI